VSEIPWPGSYYRLCEDKDTCTAAYAYWKDPPVRHYHFLGSPSAPGEEPVKPMVKPPPLPVVKMRGTVD